MWWCNALSLRLAGARPVRLTAADDVEIVRRLDGLLIGGGDDIAAHLYDGDVSLDVRIDPERDALELTALARAVPLGLPVLGVCRGAQMLNVFFGGSLHQDIHAVYVEAPRLRTVLPSKSVDLATGSRLARTIGRTEVRVNSLHSQSVDRLAGNLRAVGRDRWGIVQAVEDPKRRFMVGVQWHPEFLFYRKPQLRLFVALARAARRGRAAAPEPDAEPAAAAP
jgi:putative glutamine amidotransferase